MIRGTIQITGFNIVGKVILITINKVRLLELGLFLKKFIKSMGRDNSDHYRKRLVLILLCSVWLFFVNYAVK